MILNQTPSSPAAAVSLLPDESTEVGHDRLHHHDLAALTPEQRWAEARLIEAALAAAIFTRQRSRILYVSAIGPVTDHEWLRERFARLRSKTAERRAA